MSLLKDWKTLRCENCGNEIRVPLDMYGRPTTKDCGCLDDARKKNGEEKADEQAPGVANVS